MTFKQLEINILNNILSELEHYLQSDSSLPVVSCSVCGRDMTVTKHTVDDLICSPVVEPCGCGDE